MSLDDLWKRALAREPSLVRGVLPEPLRAPKELLVLRVRADRRDRPLGPLGAAAVRAAAELGIPASLDAPAATWFGARARMLRESPEAYGVARAVELLHELSRRSRRPVLVLVDEAGAASEGALDVLSALVVRRLLRVPVALVEGRERGAPFASAAGEWEARFGEAVWCDADPRREDHSLPAMPDEVRLTLRAAAVAGDGFDVDSVALVRSLEKARVLEHLQIARDLGVDLEDLGDGRFHLPSGAAEVLRASVLPSLARAWHELLAAHFSRPRPMVPSPMESDEPEAPEASPAPDASAWGSHYAEDPVEKSASPFSIPPAPLRASARVTIPPPPQEPSRAAEHLEAAGDPEGAARALLASSATALGLGAAGEALQDARRAKGLVDALTATPKRRALVALCLAASGRARWIGSGPGEAFTLVRAIDDLRAAWSLRGDLTDPNDLAAVAVSFAGALQDRGDLAALDEALQVLSEATRAMLGRGDAVGAARLLNDQAAIHVGLGDPVRAAWLLERSRASLEAGGDAPEMRRELAETDHLFAQLPLLVKPRAGREEAALELARDHATHAESVYRALGLAREALRVGETIARLDLRAGRVRHAEERLRTVMDAQRVGGDMVGLARSSSALSEVLARTQRWAEAVQCLSDSIAFNTEKGAAAGLAHNRKAVESLRSAVGDALEEPLRRLQDELEAAEGLVGRIDLPGG